MKYTLALVFALVSAVAFGQNSPLQTKNVVTNFSAISLPGNHETIPAAVSDIGVSFTPNTTLFLETLQTPAAADFYGFYGAGASYQLNALSKLINDASPNQSGFKFRFTLTGSVGEVRVGDRNHFGGTARFRTEYALTSGGGWNLAAEVGAARLPGVAPKWGPVVAIGQSIHF